MIRQPLIFFILFQVLVGNVYSDEYFQQEVNYIIKVELDDIKHELSAHETIEYINNSPDTLHYIYFHLWPNAYKNNSTALAKQLLLSGKTNFYFAAEEQRGYIDSLDFKVNNIHIEWEYDQQYVDICKLMLNEPLFPGNKITISTPFHVKIPKGIFSRLGHIGQSYQISQWYPKPAVYDKYGWHQMPYLEQGEFYSEFGSFDVFITLPDNYTIASTGNLQSIDELCRLDELSAITSEIKCYDKFDMNFPPSSQRKKTIRYTQDNVHDFAWFADKRFHVLKSEVVLPHTNKKVTTWAMFTNDEAHLWINSTQYINNALYYYSLWNGDYPYDNCTAVLSSLSAGGGMEYPMITVIAISESELRLEQIIVHEVGHNWFYGILGFNEREFPYLDEGINSFNELRYFDTKYPDKSLFEIISPFSPKFIRFFNLQDFPGKSSYELGYLYCARKNSDQPATLSSEEFTSLNYGTILYMKVPYILNYLKSYIGEETFDNSMQEFYAKWKFKHPDPDDLRTIFERNTDKNLNWFFDELLQTSKKIDYEICRIKNNKVKVKNKGQIQAPFTISGINKNEAVFSQWQTGFSGKKWIEFPQGNYSKIKIDSELNMPDINKKNNIIKTSGIFKKTEPFEFQFLASIENHEKTQLFYLPVAGWNYYNKFMLGAVLHNGVFPQKKIEFQLMPFYSFGTNNIAGSGKILFNFTPAGNFLQDITLSFSALQYAYKLDFAFEPINNLSGNFNKIKSEIDFKIQSIVTRPVNYHLRFSIVRASNVLTGINRNDLQYRTFYNFEYLIENKRKINPFRISLKYERETCFERFMLDTRYRFTYISEEKGLNIHLFAGKMYDISDRDNSSFTPPFRLNGISGSSDYQYQHTYFARFENVDKSVDQLWAHQFIQDEGGFSNIAPVYCADWMISSNISASIPKVPFRIYTNIATFASSTYVANRFSNSNVITEKVLYESGIELVILNDNFSIFLPLFMSSELRDYNKKITDNYWQRIRFTLNLNKLNPFSLVKKVEI